MCGIVGVSGVDGAAKLAFLGLYALQHRGQESVGISAVAADGHARLSKREGLVAEAFDDRALDALPGRVALGHTRYSTAGGAGLVNAQPIVVSYRQGDLGLVHNGNITKMVKSNATRVIGEMRGTKRCSYQSRPLPMTTGPRTQPMHSRAMYRA